MHTYECTYVHVCLHTIKITYFLVGLALAEDTDEQAMKYKI